MAELELKNVNKDYKLENKTKFTALTDINVSFEKGELVSIIGESGSGKSTLMNIIDGLDSDYSGEIKIDGMDLKSVLFSNLLTLFHTYQYLTMLLSLLPYQMLKKASKTQKPLNYLQNLDLRTT